MKFTEKVDMEILKVILKKVNSVPTSDGKSTLGTTDNKYQKQCKKSLEKYSSLPNKNGETLISYEQNKQLKTRYVCENGIGLQLIPRKVRSHVCGEFYEDIDIVACHHVIIKNLLIRMGEKVPEILIEYLDDKKGFEKKYGLSKNDMIKFINKKELNKAKKFRVLEKLHTLIYKDLLFDLRGKEKVFLKRVDKILSERDIDYNKEGKTISQFLQREENKILQAIIGYIKANTDIKIGVLCYDGLMLEKNININEDLFKKIEEAVKENTKYDIKIVKKEFDYSWDYKNAPDDDNDDEITDEEGNISDEKAYKLFREFYKDRMIVDGDFIIFLKNEFGIWETEPRNGSEMQEMIFDFGRLLKSKKMVYNLKNEGTRGNFKSGITSLFHNKRFKFNNNPFILPFKNGVVELKSGIFRIAETNEYIRDFIDYDYVKTSTSNIDYFLNQIFDDEILRTYFINELTMSLEGVNRFQRMIFLIGVSACNGKSTILELMSAALDHFGVRMSTQLITGVREKAEAANEAMMSLKEKRFAYCTEPETGKKININTVKEMTGDEITSRGNHGRQEEFKVNSCLFMASQFAPDLDGVDEGIIRRVCIIPFDKTFVLNPTKPNERQLKIFTFEEKDNLKIELINLLINNYTKLHEINFKFDRPKIVEDFTEDYFNDNDIYKKFVSESIEITKNENDFLSVDETFRLFKDFTDTNINKDNFCKKINKILGKTIRKREEGRQKPFFVGCKVIDDCDFD